MRKQIRHDDFIIAVGKRLAEIRIKAEKTHEDVYFDTHIHIGRIETGKYNISISTLYELCNYYGISIQEFFSTLKIKTI